MQWFIFFLILPHLKPSCLEYLWPVLDLMFDMGRVLSTLVIIYLYIRKNKLPSIPIWILAILQGWLLLLTYLNKGELRVIIISSVSILAVTCTLDLFLACPAMLIRGLMGNMEWLIYGNLLSIIFTYPNGLYISDVRYQHSYFLGYRNGFFQYVLLAVLVAALYSHIEKKKVRPLCLVAAGYLCILITWSATSVVALALVAAFMLLSRQKMERWITFSSVFGVTMAANLAISVFRIMDRVSWMSWVIERMLHKQVTLSGRTYIWDQFLRKFFLRPFSGYGYGDHVLDPFVGDPLGAHNQYFEFLLEGGIFALAIFLLFNIMMGKALSHCKDVTVQHIFLSVLAGLYVIFIAEAYTNSPFVCALMMLAYHADKFSSVSGPTTSRVRFVIKRGSHVTNRKFCHKY